MSGPNDDGDRDEAQPVEVPIAELAPDTLRALIEAFVAREGTDYGAVERTLAEKVADVRRQLERGEARIEFDPTTESIDVVRVMRPRRR
jgi:hypothetical protein